MHETPSGFSIPALIIVVALTLPATPRASADPDDAGETLQLSSDLRVSIVSGRDLELEVRPSPEDDYVSIAKRVTASDRRAQAISDWNGGRPPKPERWVRIPLELLSPDFRSLVLRNLFPGDHHDGEDWIHVARSAAVPVYGEGLWQVAEWFAREGDDFKELMRVNGLSSPELRAGQKIRVPAKILDPAFLPRMRSDDGALEYGSDSDGPYAAYRLQQGEALYSGVVVRFTGRTGADDVRALSERLSARSGVPDLTDIPVNYEIKIPLDLLEPEYLPIGHPRRIEAEARSAELARELARQPVAGTRGGLRGVLVIIDPGHGGRDLGTMNNGIWEHDYVYDVGCRLKRELESRSAATVMMTLVDMDTGCEPSTTDKLVANRKGTILTDPPFLAREEGEAKIGVNLRWYLANSIYREASRKGLDADRVVFLSLHADSRHPSLRGVMVYVPGADYRTKTYGHDSRLYRQYEEVREKPLVHFSRKERVRSEAVSRKLAESIVQAFRNESLAVQAYQPIRDKVIRGNAKWVPAVLRGNAIPNKVLVEMVNLSNPKDAGVLASAAKRERLGHAVFLALYDYFGEHPDQVATTAP